MGAAVMSTKESLLNRLRKDRAELSRIEAREWLEDNYKHVGRWFKYRNCYSCPEKPSDYWWAYKKVLSIKNQHFVSFEFQTDKYGDHTIRNNRFDLLSGWVPCTEEEGQKAWRKLVNAMKSYKP
jgi:hypothetical protein